jgi:hypothetical protein
MKRNLVSRTVRAFALVRMGLLLALCGLAFEKSPNAAHAQRPVRNSAPVPAAAPVRDGTLPENALRIRRFNALGGRQRVRTPSDRTSSRPREWVEIRAVYDVREPEWIDEIVFRYHVMTMTEEGGERRYSLFQTTVRYADVQRGVNRNSTVFLRYPAVERFGAVVAAGVEVLHAGDRVTEISEEDGGRFPVPAGEKWYRNPVVLDSPSVTRREGYLLNRAQSPWKHVAMDDYEYIKP